MKLKEIKNYFAIVLLLIAMLLLVLPFFFYIDMVLKRTPKQVKKKLLKDEPNCT